jgi:hypothetical protein
MCQTVRCDRCLQTIHAARQRLMGLIAFVAMAGCGLLLAGEPTPAGSPKAASKPEPAAISWQTDYIKAMDVANQQGKMLLIFFADAANPLSGRFESEVLAHESVVGKLGDIVCARLPTDTKVEVEGKQVELIRHTAFRELLGQPGIAILDFAHPQTPLHGKVVSTFPLTGRLWYTPQQVQVILDLPQGTVTQRTLIYAVRTHPETPSSAVGNPDSRLLAEAASHSDHQASIRLQGHHQWGARFPRISAMLGCSAREVCAESWPGQNLVEAAIECVRCWRLSRGHWSAVRAQNQGFGYDMRLGSNGVWYATGIFGMR